MKNNYSKLFVVVLLAILFVNTISSYGASDSTNRVDLIIGTQRIIALPTGIRISKVDVADESIVNVKLVGKNKVFITALKKGLTSVNVWEDVTEGTSYIVTTWNILPEMIEDDIKDIPGVTLMLSGSKMLLRGDVITDKDLVFIRRRAEAFPDDLIDLVNIDKHAENKEKLKLILNAIGNPNVDAHFVGEGLVLTGIVYGQEDKDLAGEVAKAYVGETGTVANAIIVTSLSVEIGAIFAQVTRTGGYEIGAGEHLGILGLPTLELSTKATGAAAAGQLFAGSLTYGGVAPTLKLLEGKGLAKILDQAFIATKSGKPGVIQRGGTLYVKTSGTTSGDLVPVEFGLILEVTPVVKPVLGPDNKPMTDSNGNIIKMIDFEVQLEVSQPVEVASTIGADIQIDKYKTSTFGSVQENYTLVISGLKQTAGSQTKKKVPILGSLPLLNILFGRDDKSTSQTDVAIFLTPTVTTVEKPTGTGGKTAPQSRHAPRTRDEATDPDVRVDK